MKIQLVDLSNKNQLIAIDKIFFNTSSKKVFKSISEKEKFKYKYMGYYLKNYSEYFYVATLNEKVVGYLCCCPNTLQDDYFFNISGYYNIIDKNKIIEYPAHLHINLTQECRGRGIGSIMIKTLCQKLALQSLSGIHVFTTPDSLNVSFYRKNDFRDELTVEYHDSNLLFLGRKISITDQ